MSAPAGPEPPSPTTAFHILQQRPISRPQPPDQLPSTCGPIPQAPHTLDPDFEGEQHELPLPRALTNCVLHIVVKDRDLLSRYALLALTAWWSLLPSLARQPHFFSNSNTKIPAHRDDFLGRAHVDIDSIFHGDWARTPQLRLPLGDPFGEVNAKDLEQTNKDREQRGYETNLSQYGMIRLELSMKLDVFSPRLAAAVTHGADARHVPQHHEHTSKQNIDTLKLHRQRD